MDLTGRGCREAQISSTNFSQAPQPITVFAAAQDHSHGPWEASRPRRGFFSTLLWSLSGGTALSIVGFIVLTLYQQYNDSLTELRNDLKHFHMTCGDLVKKDDVRNRMNQMWTSVKELSGDNTDRKTRLALLEHQLKSSEEERRELGREVQRSASAWPASRGARAPCRPPTPPTTINNPGPSDHRHKSPQRQQGPPLLRAAGSCHSPFLPRPGLEKSVFLLTSPKFTSTYKKGCSFGCHASHHHPSCLAWE